MHAPASVPPLSAAVSDTVSDAVRPLSAPVAPSALAQRLGVAGLGLLLALALLWGTGFAHAPLLHSAAHDARHGLALPCH